MIETECQQLMIEAVREMHGEGLKLNNRFLVGVVDLLLKMPDIKPMWLEAKLERLSARTVVNPTWTWELGVTQKQKQWLRKWSDAGMLTGVVSFVQVTGRDVRSLRMALYSFGYMITNDWEARMCDHRLLGDKDDRLANVRDMLREFSRRN